MSISPKLANSTPHEREGGKWAAQHERLALSAGGPAAVVGSVRVSAQFVIAAPEDLDEYRADAGRKRGRSQRVVSDGRRHDVEVTVTRAAWLTEICKHERLPVQPAPAHRPMGRPARRLIHWSLSPTSYRGPPIGLGL